MHFSRVGGDGEAGSRQTNSLRDDAVTPVKSMRSSTAVGSLEHEVETAELAEVAELRAKLGRLAGQACASGHGSRAAAAAHTGRVEAARLELQQKEAALSVARRASPAAERPA